MVTERIVDERPSNIPGNHVSTMHKRLETCAHMLLMPGMDITRPFYSLTAVAGTV